MTLDFVWENRPGWYGPTESIVRTIRLYDAAGIARTASPHLYKPALTVPMGAELPKLALEGEKRLISCIDPKGSSKVSGVGLAFSQLKLAATQNYRIFAILMGLPNLKRESLKKGKLKVYRNAEWKPVKSAGKTKRIEGCLSAPGLLCEVWRWNEIYVKFQGTEEWVHLKGNDAWIWQHENGHNNGEVCHDLAFNQGLRVHFAPEEAGSFSHDDPASWPYPVAWEFWSALKTGKFDFMKPPRS